MKNPNLWCLPSRKCASTRGQAHNMFAAYHVNVWAGAHAFTLTWICGKDLYSRNNYEFVFRPDSLLASISKNSHLPRPHDAGARAISVSETSVSYRYMKVMHQGFPSSVILTYRSSFSFEIQTRCPAVVQMSARRASRIAGHDEPSFLVRLVVSGEPPYKSVYGPSIGRTDMFDPNFSF